MIGLGRKEVGQNVAGASGLDDLLIVGGRRFIEGGAGHDLLPGLLALVLLGSIGDGRDGMWGRRGGHVDSEMANKLSASTESYRSPVRLTNFKHGRYWSSVSSEVGSC